MRKTYRIKPLVWATDRHGYNSANSIRGTYRIAYYPGDKSALVHLPNGQDITLKDRDLAITLCEKNYLAYMLDGLEEVE